MTHDDLRAFLRGHEGGDLRTFGLKQTDVVCSALPNGPEAICVFLAIPLQCVYAPLHHDLNEQEAAHKIKILEAKAIVIHTDDQNIEARRAALELGITIIELTPDNKKAGKYTFKVVRPGSLNSSGTVGNSVVKKDDEAVVLLTSGSTGDPKAVPIRHEQLWASAFIRAALFQFKRTDVCMNILPLYHLHGIRVNALPILVAGGTVLCTKGFGGQGLESPDSVVGILTNPQYRVTFYSAVPTVHQLVLAAAEKKAEEMGSGAFKNSVSLRIISSGSASLPPETAKRLEAVFGCESSIFYALTEMQPEIYEVPGTEKKRGSVGRAWGANMRVGHVNDEAEAQIKFCTDPEDIGEVLLKSQTSAMRGYKNTDKDEFVDGWFRTGDMGKVDQDGYLFLTGRSKEVINRGGETISPFEVENEAISLSGVEEAMAFSAPHPMLQETVGLAIVTKKKGPERPSLAEVHEELSSKLHSSKIPQVLVYMDDLPKSGTRKLLRIGFAKRCSMPPWEPGCATYEASSVPVGTPLDAPLTLTKVETEDIGDSVEETPWGTMWAAVTGSTENTETEVDSLGFVLKQRKGADKRRQDMAMKIRDNCYFMFCSGIMIDHCYGCYALEGYGRKCMLIYTSNAANTGALQAVVGSVGDTKCQLGMLIIGGFFHQQDGPGFGKLDFALSFLYLTFTNWYYLPFYFLLEAFGQEENSYGYIYNVDENLFGSGTFGGPRWFILCFIYGRWMIHGSYYLNKLLSFKWGDKTIEPLSPPIQLLVFGIIAISYMGYGTELCNLFPEGGFRDTVCYGSPLFLASDMYGGHSRPACVWQSLLVCSWIYLLSFHYSQAIVAEVERLAGQAKGWHLQIIAALAFMLFWFLAFYYNYSRQISLDMPAAWWANEEYYSKGEDFSLNKYLPAHLLDGMIQTFEALLAMVFMSQAPFHLKWFGSSTLGAYVYQMAFRCFIDREHSMWHLMAYLQNYTKTHDYAWANVFVFCCNVAFVFGSLLLYWVCAAVFLCRWTMLPFTIAAWIPQCWAKARENCTREDKKASSEPLEAKPLIR